MLTGSWPAGVLSVARATVRAMLLANASPPSALDPLLDSVWLRRLGGVSFLGTLDAQPDARVRTTRLEHSVGVAAAADRVGRAAGLTREALTTFVLAGLLHDVGHYPLSHSAEEALSRLYGGDHHDVTRWILLGEGPVSPNESLRPLLERLGCDPREIWAVTSGEPQSTIPATLAECFSAPLNLDTLEAIPRVADAFGLAYEAPGTDLLDVRADQLLVPPTAIARADRFWELKDQVYVGVVNRPSNVLYEEAVSATVAQLDAGSLGPLESLDDRALLDAIPQVHLDVARVDATSEVILDREGPRVRKRYRVDRGIASGPLGLPVSEWGRRYVHYRERVRVMPTVRGHV